MPLFEFKFAFQNVNRIMGWLLKQSCRTLNFEQLLFLEIFELPHKFGSKLGFKASGNSVISMNSARGSHLIAGELLTRSGRRRGHPWLHAGTGRLRRGFSLLLSCALRAYVAAVLLLFIPLFSCRHRPAPASSCHRRSAIQSQQRPS